MINAILKTWLVMDNKAKVHNCTLTTSTWSGEIASNKFISVVCYWGFVNRTSCATHMKYEHLHVCMIYMTKDENDKWKGNLFFHSINHKFDPMLNITVCCHSVKKKKRNSNQIAFDDSHGNENQIKWNLILVCVCAWKVFFKDRGKQSECSMKFFLSLLSF